ncbi:MAG: M1 family metallopeptidase [candidate division Zixibacteria bacterium]|nr:M1 family metallopeptidase [candidate division Zixibacteria bacterium]
MVFKYAPKPLVVDGILAVPINILNVTASMTFNAANKTAQCTAVMQFVLGHTGGNPIFDLRQTILSASLDGNTINPAKLAHHDFGGGLNTQLRIIEEFLNSNTTHSLTLIYDLGTPDAPNAQSIGWSSNTTRLSFDIYLSDLNPARYLEMWLPSNLLFDEFPVDLEVRITGSAYDHVLMTNGNKSDLGTNHWRIAFPATFCSSSHLLLIESADKVELLTDNISLSGGNVVTLELMKFVNDTSINLADKAITLGSYLIDFDNNIGPYLHGNRFVALLDNTVNRSMEYDGGTTSNIQSLRHETFHSWWARGMRPASGDDGWLDEGWTMYYTSGSGPNAIPFDMTDTPVKLWYNNPFKRNTPNASYVSGANFFSGLAADLGIALLQNYMSEIYREQKDRRYSTPFIEAELIRRSGKLELADYFDRFVYGYGNLPDNTKPDLYLRDATDDNGDIPYNGAFWRSPDVWVRKKDDGGTTHQDPEFGQDNWFYARVNNRGSNTARSFVVGFKINVWAGIQFIYPGDWLPLTAVTVGFNLAPGSSQIVKVRWPKEDIPPTGSHGCLLAVVYNSDDVPSAGTHVWENNNLAQRNLTIVDLEPGETAEIPVWIGNRYYRRWQYFMIEICRPETWPQINVEISHPRFEVVRDLFKSAENWYKKIIRSVQKKIHPSIKIFDPKEIILDNRAGNQKFVIHPTKNSNLTLEMADRSDFQEFSWPERPPIKAELIKKASKKLTIRFNHGKCASFPIILKPGVRHNVILKVEAPRDAKLRECLEVDLMQRNTRGQVIGGITVQINIIKKKRR